MAYSGAGIYALYNVMKNKIYIGESTNIEKRFYGHRRNFALKSKTNEMYKEPVDDFAFIVLLELSDDEHAKMGRLLESLFIAKALREGIKVYNQNKVSQDVTGEILFFFGIYDMIDDRIKEEVGQAPWNLKMMKDETKRYYLRRMRSERPNRRNDNIENVCARW